MNIDNIKPYDEILIGNTKSLVCKRIKNDSVIPVFEVIYINDADREISKLAYWVNERWEFSELPGDYADKHSRFSPFISHLRNLDR